MHAAWWVGVREWHGCVHARACVRACATPRHWHPLRLWCGTCMGVAGHGQGCNLQGGRVCGRVRLGAGLGAGLGAEAQPAPRYTHFTTSLRRLQHTHPPSRLTRFSGSSSWSPTAWARGAWSGVGGGVRACEGKARKPNLHPPTTTPERRARAPRTPPGTRCTPPLAIDRPAAAPTHPASCRC